MKVAFYTFGCKVNQAETGSLIGIFSAGGFEIRNIHEECDVYVINSCTVTAEGEAKARRLLHRLRREHPSAVIAFTGCVPQAAEDPYRIALEADVVTGARDRAALLPAVLQALECRERVVRVAPHQEGETYEALPTGAPAMGRTRAFLKIQDGCERWCAYCAIPRARGPFRSQPLSGVREEAEALVSQGFREIVLTGINLSAYGTDSGGRLSDAVRAVSGIPGLLRLRLSSLEPELLAPEDFALFAELPNFCPHFHLSLQSGCDATLERMGRLYRTREFRELVNAIRSVFPNPAITTDIMSGFPGEDETEFAQSLQFFREMGFARAHVFPYSRRPGTAASSMENQVPQPEKFRRAGLLREAAAESRARFLSSQAGTEAEVLFEAVRKDGFCHGYTQNYTPVRVHSPVPAGEIRKVRILRAEESECVGELIRSC